MRVCPKVALCRKEDVGEGKAIRVVRGALALAVFRVESEFFVTNDECTHGPGSLSEGDLSGHVVECDFHNGAFDIRTGEVVSPPCMIPLTVYKTTLDGEDVMAELPE